MSTPRVRESDSTTLSQETLVISRGPGCTTETIAFNGYRSGVYKKMEDVVTPNFRELSAKGVIVNTPMSYVRNTFSGTNTGHSHIYSLSGWSCMDNTGQWKFAHSNLLSRQQGPLPLLWGDFQLPDADLITDAATRARAGVKSPSVQGLVFLAEMQQTLSLLKNPLSAMQRLLDKQASAARQWKRRDETETVQKIRRRKGKAVTRLLPEEPALSYKSAVAEAASGQYLAYAFGMVPLMHDVEGLLEALVKAVTERETSRATANDSSTADSTIRTYSSTSGLTGVWTNTRKVEEITVRAGCMYAFNGRALQDSLGFSYRDIPGSLWEAMPWSFVVDWLSNVGHLINAISASCTNEFLAEWMSVHRKMTWSRFITNTTADTPGHWNIGIPCRDKDEAVYETYSRIPSNLGLHMGLVFNLTLNRVPVLSAISLLLQQLTKRK